MIVAFHIGSGRAQGYGGFGQKKFIGERTLQEVICDNMYRIYRRVRFKNNKYMPYLIDCSIIDGHPREVCDTPDAEIGVLDFDGDYDTYICKHIEECTEEELEIIRNSNKYKSKQLIDAIR